VVRANRISAGSLIASERPFVTVAGEAVVCVPDALANVSSKTPAQGLPRLREPHRVARHGGTPCPATCARPRIEPGGQRVRGRQTVEDAEVVDRGGTASQMPDEQVSRGLFPARSDDGGSEICGARSEAEHSQRTEGQWAEPPSRTNERHDRADNIPPITHD
jgi:hypothetical protein